MTRSARAFWTVAPGRGEIRAETLEPPDDAHLILRTVATGISRGTEALVFAGRVPPGQHAAMRAPMMSGDFPFPVKYGYSAVGAAADGALFFALHPHQDVMRVPRALCVPVPRAVPPARATLGANMETALNILWDAAPLAGERVMVVGAGVVGLLAASLLARVPGCAVTVVDPNGAREPVAGAFGAAFHAPADAPRDQDLIVHASATEAGLRTALASAAFEGRIVEASWFGDAAPALPLGEAFHAGRLRLISSQVGAVATPMRGRRTHTERLALALDLLADPRYDLLLDGEVPFESLPDAMPRLLSPGRLCTVVTYREPACSA